MEVRTYPQRKVNGLVFLHTMWFPATRLSPQPLSWSGSRLSFLSTWQSAEGPKLGYFPEAGWVSTLIEMLKKLCRRIKPLILLPFGWQEQIPACEQAGLQWLWALEMQAVGGCALGKPVTRNGDRDLQKRQLFPFQHFKNPTELSSLFSSFIYHSESFPISKCEVLSLVAGKFYICGLRNN